MNKAIACKIDEFERVIQAQLKKNPPNSDKNTLWAYRAVIDDKRFKGLIPFDVWQEAYIDNRSAKAIAEKIAAGKKSRVPRKETKSSPRKKAKTPVKDVFADALCTRFYAHYILHHRTGRRTLVMGAFADWDQSYDAIAKDVKAYLEMRYKELLNHLEESTKMGEPSIFYDAVRGIGRGAYERPWIISALKKLYEAGNEIRIPKEMHGMVKYQGKNISLGKYLNKMLTIEKKTVPLENKNAYYRSLESAIRTFHFYSLDLVMQPSSPKKEKILRVIATLKLKDLPHISSDIQKYISVKMAPVKTL